MKSKNKIAYPMGDVGVYVKLWERPVHYPSSTQGGRVYWAAIKYNVPSYVIADPISSLEGLTDQDKRGRFYHSESDTYVRLISVNGAGEIRWTVDPLMLIDEHSTDAAIFFGLIDAPERS